VADAYRSEGYTVRAVSVANSAVEVLRTDTDVPARSVASELWQWSQDRERLGPRDLLIVDEASTLGTAWARDLLAEARTRGEVVVLLGDHRQFQAVAYGNALGAAQAIEPGVDMQTTMRQKTEWQARATEDLRAGRIRAGLDAYNRNGLIHQHATQAEARAGIIAEWKAIERGGVDRDPVECGIETLTNAERIELNALARKAQDELGRLHGPEVVLETLDGPTAYRAGDRVIIRETIRDVLYRARAARSGRPQHLARRHLQNHARGPRGGIENTLRLANRDHGENRARKACTETVARDAPLGATSGY
jgi:ATP-dependent exoDNAse (exonuclease V) alpha subunit